MKKFLIILMVLTIIGCSDSKSKTKTSSKDNTSTKSYSELETESLSTGIKRDSLYLGFVFGMTKKEYDRRVSELIDKNQIQLEEEGSIVSIMNIGNYNLYSSSNYFFDDDVLFRVVQHIYPEKSEKTSDTEKSIDAEIISLIEKDGSKRHENGNQSSKYFWLKGNKRIDFFDTDNEYIISSSDIIREREINARLEKEEGERIEKEKKEEKIIFAKLKEKAKRDWPNDYTTQEYWINEQKEAYEYMKSIPNDEIKKKAQRDWPLDFSTQKFWYNEQIEAKKRLQ